MKTILLMTDFSDNAKNAIQYAIQMFGEETAYILLNTYTVRENSGTFVSVASRIKEIAEEEMGNELMFIKAKFPQYPNLKITTQVKREGSIDGVKRVGNQYPIDLIVMGTKGASGLTKILIGSVTASVVKETNFPVFIIPEKAKYEGVKKIVFAINNFSVDDDLLIPLVSIIKKEQSELHLLTVLKEAEKSPKGKDYFLESLKEIKQKIIYVEGEDVSEEVEKYAIQNNIDLITVVARHNKFFDRLFHKSVSQELIFQAKLPILVLEGSYRD